jgi:hypothetical protein
MVAIVWPRRAASGRLPENGRKIVAAPQIGEQIDDKTVHIKCLDIQMSMRPAGKRSPVLREAAGRVWVDILRRSLMVSGCQKHTLTFDKIAHT